LPDSKPLFRTATVGDGVRLHLLRTRAFKTIAARLVLHANLDDATAARALVPRVLGRGTRRLDSLLAMQIELDRLFGASLGGDVRKLVDRHLVQIRSDWILDRLAGEPLLEQMGKLFGEFLHDPASDEGGGLRETIVAHERKMMADEAASIIDDKGRYARFRLVEEMCRGEAFARPAIGRLEEIRAVQASDVDRAYRWLLERAPADLFLVGDLTMRHARVFARALRLGGRRPARVKRTRRKRPDGVRTVKERERIEQARLAMGFRTRIKVDSPLVPALVVMNALFGGLPIGKLFKVVRERESLCYAVHSIVERTKGILFVQAAIQAGNYAKARRLILKQLDELQRGVISAESFEQARGMLLGGVRAMRDSPGALIDYALDRVANGSVADLEAQLRDLEAVTIADVTRAARSVELDTVFFLGS